MIPVTAGKNTANTTQKPSLCEVPPSPWTSTPSNGLPKSRERSERPMAAMMKYWARIATLAEVRANKATPTVVTRPTSLRFKEGKVCTRLSANPTV
jgi:hypothetical protein